jgi:hypothetical protein
MILNVDKEASRRTLAAPFNLIGRSDDLRKLAEEILAQIEHGERVSIVQIRAAQPLLGDTRPVPWSKAA